MPEYASGNMSVFKLSNTHSLIFSQMDVLKLFPDLSYGGIFEMHRRDLIQVPFNVSAERHRTIFYSYRNLLEFAFVVALKQLGVPIKRIKEEIISFPGLQQCFDECATEKQGFIVKYTHRPASAAYNVQIYCASHQVFDSRTDMNCIIVNLGSLQAQLDSALLSLGPDPQDQCKLFNKEEV